MSSSVNHLPNHEEKQTDIEKSILNQSNSSNPCMQKQPSIPTTTTASSSSITDTSTLSSIPSQQQPKTINLQYVRKSTNWYFELNDSLKRHNFRSFFAIRHLSYFFQFAIFIITLIILPVSLLNAWKVLTSNHNDYPNNRHYYGHIGIQIVLTINIIGLSWIGWRICYDHSSRIMKSIQHIRLLFSRVCNCCFLRRNDATISTTDNLTNPASTQLPQGGLNRSNRIAQDPSFFAALPNPSSPTQGAKTLSTSMDDDHSSSENSPQSPKLLSDPKIQVIFAVLVQTLILLSIFRQVILRICTNEDTPTMTMKLATASLAYSPRVICDYPEFYLIMICFWLYAVPYFMFTALWGVSIACVWSIYTMTFVAMVILVNALSAPRALLFIVLIVIWFVTMVIDLQLHKIYVFFTNQSMLEIVEQHQSMAIKHTAQEMRHMIANVAHDLKTVSTSDTYIPAILSLIYALI